MANNQAIDLFKSGVHNLLDDENVPQDAASAALNWYDQDGRTILVPGKLRIGAEGIAGSVTGEIFGYKINGTQVHWRKIGATIQYNSGTAAAPVWTTVISGLTSSADYSFSNYSSLAGSFTFAVGVDGIYKMNNANPGSFNTMYDSTKNFKGKAIIDKGRMILWDRPEDKTGLYGSWIDTQEAVSGSLGVYTAVSGEATTSLAGTLAFKAGGATRNCFGVTITLTGTGEVYRDSYLGTLTGSLGGTGTINYITGAYTLSNAGVGTAAYQWENSNLRGVTDFGKSATRAAGQGFQFPQDEGGDAIQTIINGPDGVYYSMKKQSVYRLALEATDTNATNEVFRKNIGVPSYRSSISTGKGIVFINTANPSKPELTILQKNAVGDSVEPFTLFPHFKFANYVYDDCMIDTFERYILVACKTPSATANDTILLCDLSNNTVDITGYNARTSAQTNGLLYVGSSVSQTVYNLYSGFDDDGYTINNYRDSRGELYGTEVLKKFRKLRFRGSIAPDQVCEIYINYDNAGFQLVGTIVGSGSYVDYTSPQSIGSNFIGSSQVGGDDLTNIYPFQMEIRLKKVPKFRTRKIRFKATGVGYMSIESQLDWDISTYQDKLPSQYRQKQNVNLAGTTTDNAAPEF
tara:strand:- start:3679 stop:5577 length:1899 start_codon:yes stop_codon:yes gene_type:complete